MTNVDLLRLAERNREIAAQHRIQGNTQSADNLERLAAQLERMTINRTDPPKTTKPIRLNVSQDVGEIEEKPEPQPVKRTRRKKDDQQ